MFNRYRLFLMAPEGDVAPGTPPAPAAPPAPPVAAPASPPAPAPGEEFKAMTGEQFAQRLAKERELATKGLLKETGFATLDEAKAFYARAREAEEAKKSSEQKMQEKLAALEPEAKKAASYEAAIKKYLEAEEKAIPEEKKGLLDLAPPADKPEARLEWIANAKAKGLFTVTPPAPVAPNNPPPATSRAGGNPPTPAPPASGSKHPRDMTNEEYAKYEAQWKAQHG